MKKLLLGIIIIIVVIIISIFFIWQYSTVKNGKIMPTNYSEITGSIEKKEGVNPFGDNYFLMSARNGTTESGKWKWTTVKVFYDQNTSIVDGYGTVKNLNDWINENKESYKQGWPATPAIGIFSVTGQYFDVASMAADKIILEVQ